MPIRITIVKIEGGLFVYAPVAATKVIHLLYLYHSESASSTCYIDQACYRTLWLIMITHPVVNNSHDVWLYVRSEELMIRLLALQTVRSLKLVCQCSCCCNQDAILSVTASFTISVMLHGYGVDRKDAVHDKQALSTSLWCAVVCGMWYGLVLVTYVLHTVWLCCTNVVLSACSYVIMRCEAMSCDVLVSCHSLPSTVMWCHLLYYNASYCDTCYMIKELLLMVFTSWCPVLAWHAVVWCCMM